MSVETKKWNEFVRLEPMLGELLKDAQAVKDDKRKPSFCANWQWYRCGFKNRLVHLVGWYARKDIPELKTREAYDLAYRYVYNALPNCRNCNCM